MVTVEPVPEHPDGQKKLELLIMENDDQEEEKTLRLKGTICLIYVFTDSLLLTIICLAFVFFYYQTGQMIYMENWRMIMFLGTPVMPDLTSLINTGLYINDLSMHDFSR